MKTKILTILLFAFCILFLLFPIPYLISNNLMFMEVIMITCAILYFFRKKIISIFKRLNGKYLWIIIILALLSRIIYALISVNYVVQISDFAGVYEHAISGDYSSAYYIVANHWLVYPYILGMIFKVFGASYTVAYIFNALVQIVTIVFFFLTAKKIFKNDKYVFIGTLIFMFIPSDYLYMAILTPEHLCIMFLMISLYFLFSFLELKNNNYRKYLYPSLFGVCLALANVFKQFGIIYIIALGIILLLYILKNTFFKSKKMIIPFCLVILSFFTVKWFAFNAMDAMVNGKVARDISAVALNVGFRSGYYDPALNAEYSNLLIKNNYDYKKTNKEILDALLPYISKNKEKILILLKGKAAGVFNVTDLTGSAKLNYYNTSLETGEHYKAVELSKKYIAPLNGYYMLFIVLLIILGLFKIHKDKDLKGYYLYIAYYGSALMLVLVEGQTRYTYVMDYLICLMAIYGIKYINDYMNNKKLEVQNDKSNDNLWNKARSNKNGTSSKRIKKA